MQTSSAVLSRKYKIQFSPLLEQLYMNYGLYNTKCVPFNIFKYVFNGNNKNIGGILEYRGNKKCLPKIMKKYFQRDKVIMKRTF